MLDQVAACLGLLLALGSLPSTSIHLSTINLGLLDNPIQLSGLMLSVLLLFAGIWWINLFNFMDGIDGIAGIQSMFMLAAGGGLSAWGQPEVLANPIWLWTVSIIGATLAFTVLNWPPASIFMGDVGSTWLAYVIFSLALISIQAGQTTYAIWLIFGAVFITDATVTLLTRMIRREPWGSAHRSHAYQQLARRWHSHRSVVLLTLGINIFVLLPLALASLIWPHWNLVWLGCAYAPMIAGVVKLEAGKNN